MQKCIGNSEQLHLRTQEINNRLELQEFSNEKKDSPRCNTNRIMSVSDSYMVRVVAPVGSDANITGRVKP